jgi:hypothetical protein
MHWAVKRNALPLELDLVIKIFTLPRSSTIMPIVPSITASPPLITLLAATINASIVTTAMAKPPSPLQDYASLAYGLTGAGSIVTLFCLELRPCC